MKLYELAQEILALQNAAYDASDEEFEALKAQFHDCKLAFNEKLENIARLIRQMQLDSESLEDEQIRLQRRQEAIESRIESLKFYVGNCLGEGNSLKTPTFSFGWRKSTSVEITGEVPEQYQRIKEVREPDKRAIGDDLKAGADLSAFARLSEKQTLQIK